MALEADSLGRPLHGRGNYRRRHPGSDTKDAGPLGQPIVVDNRPGANSILGSDIVAKAPADGYTILTVIAGYAANVTLYSGKLPFDPRKDLAPVSLAGIAPLILTANANFPGRT